MATTTYDVLVRYLLKDKASRGIAGIGREADKAAASTGLLGKTIKRLAIAGAGFLTFKAGKKLLIDYNKELNQARIQMSGLLNLNLGGTWAQNQKKANMLVQRFQKDAKKSVGTTKDFVDMGAMLVGPLTRAGASIEDIGDVTKGAVIASRAFGVEAEFAARDIEGALAGTLGKKDRFARALLEPMGLTTDKWNEMVKKTPGKASEMLLKAFRQSAIQKMADEQGKSWSGVMSTFSDNIQRAFGKVGLPLMMAITKEVQKVNAWFDANPDKVAAIIDGVANGMLTAFNIARKLFAFVIEHKTLLLALAGAFSFGRIANGAAGIFGGIKGSITTLGANLSGANGMLLKFGSRLNLAAAGLSAVYLGAKFVADRVDKKQDAAIKAQTDNPLLKEQARLLGGGDIRGGTLNGIKGSAQRQGLSVDDALSLSVLRQFRGSSLQSKSGGVNVGNAVKAFGIEGSPAFRELQRTGVSLSGKSAGEMAKALKDTGLAGAGNELKLVEFLTGVQKALEQEQRIRGEQMVKSEERMRMQWSELTEKHKGNLDKVVAEFTKTNGALAGGIAKIFAQSKGDSLKLAKGFGEAFLKLFERPVEENKKIKKDKDVKVNIAKIEVATTDPDVFAHQFVGAMDSITASPTAARTAFRDT